MSNKYICHIMTYKTVEYISNFSLWFRKNIFNLPAFCKNEFRSESYIKITS